MKKVQFKLLTNDEIIIDEVTNYYEKDSTYYFKINHDLYAVNYKNKTLQKQDQEKIIDILFSKKVIIITVLKENIKLDYPINQVSFKRTKNELLLSYTIENTEIMKNTIKLEF